MRLWIWKHSIDFDSKKKAIVWVTFVAQGLENKQLTNVLPEVQPMYPDKNKWKVKWTCVNKCECQGQRRQEESCPSYDSPVRINPLSSEFAQIRSVSVKTLREHDRRWHGDQLKTHHQQLRKEGSEWRLKYRVSSGYPSFSGHSGKVYEDVLPL